MSDKNQLWARPLWRDKSLEEIWIFGEDMGAAGGVGGSPSVHLTHN